MPIGKNVESLRAQQLLAGVKEHFANASSLTFGSGTYTPAQIEASLQMMIDLRAAVDAAKVATKAKIVAEAAQAAPLRSLAAALAAYVKVSFSQSPDVLADFGLKPRKATTPQTNEQKTLAAAKRKATRAARHTLGKTQKKNVKGTITTIVTPTPSAAPQPTAPGPVAPAASLGTSAGATPHGA